MPFTFAHIAAVLPLLRRRKRHWSATGLIAGSLAPDFEKFMRLGEYNGHSHSWASVAYFSCPVALGLAFVFHGVVRNSLIAHLPGWLHGRLAYLQHFAWGPYFRQHYGRVLLSVLLGALTHLVWDSITHRQGEVVDFFPVLLDPWWVGEVHAPGFLVVNLLSTALGLALVLGAALRLPAVARPRPSAGARSLYWGLVGFVAVGVLGGRLLLAESPLKYIDLIISAISAIMAGVAVASVCMRTAVSAPGRRA